MKTFKEYIVEKMVGTGNKHIGAARKELPQIQHPKKFRDYLTFSGVKVEDTTLPIGEIRYTQKHLNNEKVDCFNGNQRDCQSMFISKENYILDGHHRLAAVKRKHPKANVKIMKTNVSIEELIDHGLIFTRRKK